MLDEVYILWIMDYGVAMDATSSKRAAILDLTITRISQKSVGIQLTATQFDNLLLYGAFSSLFQALSWW